MNAHEHATLRAVQRVLSPELLHPEWKHAAGGHPYAGHCYAASEALFHLLGGKAHGLRVLRGRCPGGVHWYLETANGTRLDPTAEQFDCATLRAVYQTARGGGFLTRQPSARARTIMRRARRRSTL